jgi:hypothetical protein
MATQVDRSLLADLFKSIVRTMKDIGRNGDIEQRWQFFLKIQILSFNLLFISLINRLNLKSYVIFNFVRNFIHTLLP